MIAIIDYDTGNLRSVKNALHRLGAEYVVTDSENVIRTADRVLLPGVGEASEAMGKLRDRGLDKIIPSLTQPVLGICIGLQLMCRYSEEGNTDCMGVFECDVRRFDNSGCHDIKIPHMGWNTITELKSPLFKGIDDNVFVYYVHSYRPDLCSQTIAVTEHGANFSAALGRDNFFGTQFHPEKSGRMGEIILRNFLTI